MGSVQREGSERQRRPRRLAGIRARNEAVPRATGKMEVGRISGRGANFDCGEGSVWWRWWRQRVLRSIARPRAAETADGREEGSCGTCGSIGVHGRSKDLLQSGLWWMGQGTEEEGSYSN
jgi:hypothetical protein